jgi:hypothetical protein
MDEQAQPKRSRRQWEAMAKMRISKGESGSDIEKDFVRQGLDPQSSRVIVESAIRNRRSRAIALMIGGSAFAGLGLFVTLASYSAVASSYRGGTYWIWFGPIIAGSIAALVGLRRLLRARR